MRDSRIRVSLGAEMDGHLVGFLMARLYYGEFGVADPVAILDTISVDPERPREGIGRALLEQFKTNLRGVGIENTYVITETGCRNLTPGPDAIRVLP